MLRILKVFELHVVDQEVLLHASISALQELVKNVVIPLMRVELHHSAFLQEIPVNESSSYLPRPCELDSDELAKTRRIIISHSLRIAKGFQDRVGAQYLLRQVR